MSIFKKKKAAPEIVVAPSTDKTANDEIIAVIAAAIAAYEAEQYQQTLYIRKLDRTAGVRPVWGVTGTSEAIDVRRI